LARFEAFAILERLRWRTLFFENQGASSWPRWVPVVWLRALFERLLPGIGGSLRLWPVSVLAVELLAAQFEIGLGDRRHAQRWCKYELHQTRSSGIRSRLTGHTKNTRRLLQLAKI